MPQTIAERGVDSRLPEGVRAAQVGVLGWISAAPMTLVNLASTVSHTPNPVAAEVAGETVLMSLERNRCYGLGEIGSEIWKKLASPVRVTDLIAELSDRYEAVPGLIEQDVLELLNHLAAEGLLRVD
jgi:Coenzyme PQQ synthesis protein D (PqqD)